MDWLTNWQWNFEIKNFWQVSTGRHTRARARHCSDKPIGRYMRTFQMYFQPGALSEILTIANLRHAASRVWTCAEPEFRLSWMKLWGSDNHYTTVPKTKVFEIILKMLKTLTETSFWRTFLFTHFIPLIFFDTPWKHQKTRVFLVFSGGIKRDQRYEMV